MLGKIKNSELIKSILIIMSFGIIAFVSFSFGSISTFFRYAGIIVGLGALIYLMNIVANKEWKKSGLLFALIAILGVVASLSKFSSQSFHWYTNISVFLGFICFFLIGVYLKKQNKSSEIILLLIFGAIALHVLLSLGVTLVRYGFFHVAKYEGKYYFYNAQQYEISKEVLMLVGMEFKNVSIIYYSFFGVLLSSALAGLFFVNPKKDTKKFLILLAFGVFGLLSFILIGYYRPLNHLVVLLVVALWFRFLNPASISDDKKEYKALATKINKYVRTAIYICIACGLVVVLLAMVNAYQSEYGGAIAQAIKSNAKLNRLFNANRVMHPINEVLAKIFYKNNLFGYDRTNGYINNYVILVETGFFEFEVVKDVGFIGLAVLVALILVIYETIRKYFLNDSDQLYIKMIVVMFLVMFIFYNSFDYTSFPYVHDQYSYQPIFQNEITLVVIFLLGYMSFSNKIEVEEPKVEENKKEEHVDEI